MIQEIQTFRTKYPEYNDIDDSTLAKRLATKYPEYSDLPNKVRGEKPQQNHETQAPIKETVSKWSHTLLPLAGMVIGGGIAGTAATPTTFGTGTLPASVAGGTLGYAAGEGLSTWIDDLMGIGKKGTLGEAAVKTAQDIKTGLEYELGGRVLGAGVGIISKKVMSMGEKGAILKFAEKQGIKLTPAEITTNMGISQFENLLSKLPASSQVMYKQSLDNLKMLTSWREKLLETKGMSKEVEQVGQKVVDEFSAFVNKAGLQKNAQVKAIKDTLSRTLGSIQTSETVGTQSGKQIVDWTKQASDKAEVYYTKAKANAPVGNVVPINNTMKFAKTELEGILKAAPSLQDSKIVSVLKDFAGKKDMGGYEDNLAIMNALQEQGVFNKSWAGLESNRKMLNQLIAAGDKTYGSGAQMMSDSETGILKQLKKNIDIDMSAYAESQGGELQQAYDAARKFYRTVSEIKDKANVGKLINIADKQPAKFVDTVIKAGETNSIKAVKSVMGNKFQAVESRFTQDILDNAAESGTFDGQKLLKVLNSYGDDTLRAVYGGNEKINMLRSLANGALKIEQFPTVNKFYTDVVKLLEKHPEKVMQYIYQPNSVKNIRLAKTVLSPEANAEVERLFIADLLTINKDIPAVGQLVSPAKTTTKFFKYGDNVIQEAVGKETALALRDFKNVTTHMQIAERLAGNPSGTGQTLLAYGWYLGNFPFIISSVYHGNWAAAIGETVLMIAPYGAARLYLSPIGRKIITEGLKLPSGSPQAAEWLTKIIAIATNNGKEPDNLQQIQTTQPTNGVKLQELKGQSTIK